MTINKNFDPKRYEVKCYQFWKDKGFFGCGQSSGQPYSIMLPPPNVTGTLHMGHGFQHTLMDILTRYHRMMGYDVLWQPGTDHAGIATQMVVERYLHSRGVSINELGRKKFVEQVWKWKTSSGGKITKQMERLGNSADWSCERFTMDKELSNAVKEAFIRLYEDNLIYRGERLVNWDPVLLTAVSDLEVMEIEEDGQLWHINYPFLCGGMIKVATTRPETLLGDVAIAVNPKDHRSTTLVGKKVRVPLTNRIIPIIADDSVDPDFGTGCIKITPAHDFNDFSISKSHQLPLINIFTKSAKLNNNVPKEYRGLDRFDARNKVIDSLTRLGLLVKTVRHRLRVPKGDRSGSILEPYLTKQWFVKAASLGQPALEVVKNGTVKFYPEVWKNTYYAWVNNLKDWCISRQLWWGHRIPAWYDDNGNIYVGYDEDEIRQKYRLTNNLVLKQDEDVFDTWFSSALWPFSTLGWPKKTFKLTKYYPSNVLVTGFDIIFFWVARMIMFGLYFMKQVPFSAIYITGLVCDEKGQKMSKSKGNVLDPIDLIDGISLKDLVKKRSEYLMQPKMKVAITQMTTKHFPKGIKAYGADTLRFTFMSLASKSRSICFDFSRMEGYRNFCNKLWNASRFVMINARAEYSSSINIPHDCMTLADRWIYHELNQTTANLHEYITQYRFDLAAQVLYNFVWHQYCDWYLEFAKIQLKSTDQKEMQQITQCILLSVLESIIKLLHPVMPFITEEIFHRLKKRLEIKKETAIMITAYPKFEQKWIDIGASYEIDWLKKIIIAIRTMRTEVNIKSSTKVLLYITNVTEDDAQRLKNSIEIIKHLAKITKLYINKTVTPQLSSTILVNKMTLHIPLAGIIDIESECLRLKKEQKNLEMLIVRISSKLNNQKFIDNAPVDIIKKEKKALSETQIMQDKINIQLENFVLHNSLSNSQKYS